MIQKGTKLRVIDNSGAKRAECIHLYSGYQKRYARMGDIIKVAIKKVAQKSPELLKVKKGTVSKAVVITTKSFLKNFGGERLQYNQNTIVLMSDQLKYLGTRVFNKLDSRLKTSRHMKLISISDGIIF